jgi:hypothetical protein
MTTNQIEAVLEWGKAKQIIGPEGKGTILGQLQKHQEEFTEIRDAAVLLDFLPSNHSGRFDVEAELMDGIGDTIVTLILLCDMIGTTLQECDTKPEVNREESILAQHKEAQKSVVTLIWWVSEGYLGDAQEHIARILSHLRIICDMAGVTTEECLAAAYEVISRRTGKMENGVFVKNEEAKP